MLTSSWIKLLVPVQHLQIFHRFTDFVAKSRNTLYFLQQFFAAYNNLICCKAGLVRGWPNKHYCYSTRFAAAIIRMGKRFAGSRKVTQISPFINVFFSFTQMSQNLGVLVRAAVGKRRWCKRRCFNLFVRFRVISFQVIIICFRFVRVFICETFE